MRGIQPEKFANLPISGDFARNLLDFLCMFWSCQGTAQYLMNICTARYAVRSSQLPVECLESYSFKILRLVCKALPLSFCPLAMDCQSQYASGYVKRIAMIAGTDTSQPSA